MEVERTDSTQLSSDHYMCICERVHAHPTPPQILAVLSISCLKYSLVLAAVAPPGLSPRMPAPSQSLLLHLSLQIAISLRLLLWYFKEEQHLHLC